MANRHFGKVGDVWKHLLVCEVLAALEPAHYAESHAGSGAYDLVHDEEQKYGVHHFLEVSEVIETLVASAYARALHRFTSAGRARYPGSALQAMTLLGDTSEYLFCDVDPVSADDLRRWGRDLKLSRCQVVERDGMTGVAEWLDTCAGGRCVVHIDPFDPFAAQPGGLSAVRLAGRVAESGSVLVVLANVGEQVIARCDRLGRGLVRSYDGKQLPDGRQGRLRFTNRTDAATPLGPSGKPARLS